MPVKGSAGQLMCQNSTVAWYRMEWRLGMQTIAQNGHVGDTVAPSSSLCLLFFGSWKICHELRGLGPE
jgi:hypothetical protein